MKEPISRYFQMGTLTWMSFPSLSTLEAVKRVAADEYFTAVEVRSCRDDAEREEVRRVLEQAHLTVYYGAHPDLLSMKLNPNAMDEAERQRAETFLKHAVDEASYLGARGMAFLAGKWEEKMKERAYSQLLKTTIPRSAVTRRKRDSRWSWSCLIMMWTRRCSWDRLPMGLPLRQM